jgi:hypothetical protein
MEYYKLALATGLTADQAKAFELAMQKEDKPNLAHLTIK